MGTAKPVLKILDFGLAQSVRGPIDRRIRGTLAYTAPEILLQDSYDHRADLYSLGMTLFELATGVLPSAGEDREVSTRHLANRCSKSQTIRPIASRIIATLSQPFDIEGKSIIIGVSIGITLAPADGSDPDQLLRNADLALYKAKGDGKGTYRFFEGEMDRRLHDRRLLEVDMPKAITNGEFELYYQPIVELRTRKVKSFEALIRWNHPERVKSCPLDLSRLLKKPG